MKKILIIEDEADLQEALKEILVQGGFEVSQALDGLEGLNKVKKEKPDLILLDLKMPKLDGYHLLLKIKEDKKTKDIPVLVLTAISAPTSDEECKALGAVGYLVKSDLALEEIVEKIKRYI